MKRFSLAVLFAAASFAQQLAVTYDKLFPHQTISGFETTAVYLDDADHAIGARFHHLRSGFTLDMLRIQSVPQGFIWVTTFPTSNMGEPHTQEHLLLGKGNKGRALASFESMSLIESSAFTQQWTTCYHFFTPNVADVFYNEFEHTMDALLHPDYSDEEIHREVRNFGISADAKTGSLRLEEKGSVYNEMVTTIDQPLARLFHAATVAVYGPEHPLSFESGGMPAALRVIQPSDIRRFHDGHYVLANMGIVASLPKEMEAGDALTRLDAILQRLEPVKPAIPLMTEDQLPPPQPAPAGRIEYVEYPIADERKPGFAVLIWPADRKLSGYDRTLLNLFLSNLANGPDSNLYKRLVDRSTRGADFGITNVGAFTVVAEIQGTPVFVYFQDLPVAHMNDADLAILRGEVLDEMKKIAEYADGSAALMEFDKRLRSRILAERRMFDKFVNSPPEFGFRAVGSDWIDHLYLLNKDPGFRKSLTQKDDLQAIEKLAASSHNVWRDYLATWKLIADTPYVEAARPSPALVKQEESERAQRAEAELARLEERYGNKDAQAAIRRYQADYNAATAVIDKTAAELKPPKFLEHPPLTLDDALEYHSTRVAGDIPLVSSTFDSMTGATTGLALRLDGIAEYRLFYLSLLPELLTSVGVIENGKPVSYDEMAQRIRNEILSLNASFSYNVATDRYELSIRGAGNTPSESERAVQWMEMALFHPDWRMENLPRIRDLVDQSLGDLRNTMQGPEESWVDDPTRAWRRQDNPLLLATGSFLTRTHNLHRLKWMLKGSNSPAISGFFASLSKTGGSRAERKQVLAWVQAGQYPALAKLTDADRKIAVDAAKDLDSSLSDIPDNSLAADWTYLTTEMARDFEIGPQRTLAMLDEVRRQILRRGGARFFLVGASATQQQLQPEIARLATGLDSAPFQKADYRKTRRIEERLMSREPTAAHPLFVGLLDPNSQGGVFENSAPLASYRDTSSDKLLDYLSSNLYAGGGAHSIFMKTWAAGLAYSNGIRVRLKEGRINYYAERTPELPQTLRFVIDELKKAEPDSALPEYAVAGAFSGTRAASVYEDRGEGMADDLADGLMPEVVQHFHQAVLKLRAAAGFDSELFHRMSGVYAKVLPGMGVKAQDVPGGVYFVIGPEKQLAAYEEYLKKADTPNDRLWRLYPRDFWITE